VVPQDGAFELLESDAGIQPELIAQSAPGLLEHAEGVGLTSSPIQRQHQLADEPFTQGMSVDQGLQRGNGRIVAAKRENRVDTRLDHRDSNLLEPRRLPLSERQTNQVGKRIAPPQRERSIVIGESREVLAGGCHSPGASGQLLKAAGVHGCRRNTQYVAGPMGDHHSGGLAEGATQM
jgi:hypothetical protein